MKTENEGGGSNCLGVVVFCVILVGLFLLFWPGHGRDGGESARRMQCRNHQMQIALALLNYEKAFGRFPPACVKDEEGRPLYSWRVSILPFLEYQALYDQFHLDEPWDSPHNKKIAEQAPPVFQCPSCKNRMPGTTNYVLVTGPGTAWDGQKSPALKDFISGTNRTIILTEVADPNLHWAEPKDLKIDAIDPSFLDEEGNFKCNHRIGINIAFADGHVTFIAEEADLLKILKKHSQTYQPEPSNEYK
ncbi:MAG: DUF1559 domain-containing protein [Planctomycetia bacterium]|jgi:prepilin-type processing-associated H-X9-DG protein